MAERVAGREGVVLRQHRVADPDAPEVDALLDLPGLPLGADPDEQGDQQSMKPPARIARATAKRIAITWPTDAAARVALA